MFSQRLFTAQGKLIIRSLLDLDLYKLTMGQFVYRFYRGVEVTYAFLNRSKNTQIRDLVSERSLREQLTWVTKLQFTDEELNYLATIEVDGQLLFEGGYLDFLRELRLPEVVVNYPEFGELEIKVSGSWETVILWETLILSIVNELLNTQLASRQNLTQEKLVLEGDERLSHKIRQVQDKPGVIIIEFGTRRRLSREWQRHVVQRLSTEVIGSLAGTSNVALAFEFGLQPIGTMAHELFMVAGALCPSDSDLVDSQREILEKWYGYYGRGLSIALTDTFGTEAFFRDFDHDMAVAWKGIRQDSGSPFEFGERTVRFYEEIGVDPIGKVIVFSDGLDIDRIMTLQDQFASRIGIAYGWGTNLTNDVGLPPFSLVVKAIAANDHPTVKLSDNLAKAMGPDKEVNRYKEAFGYEVAEIVPCVY